MKKQLAIIFILAAVLVISGCSSNTSSTVATTAATTAATTSLSGGATTTASGVTTTTGSSFYTLTCADMIPESKLTEIIGSQIKYKSQKAVLSQCQYDATGSASAETFSSNDKYVVYAAGSYATMKMLESRESTYHETNKVGSASFDYVNPSALEGTQVYFLDSSGKYTIRVLSRSTDSSPSLASIDQLYQIAAELDKNVDKITQE